MSLLYLAQMAQWNVLQVVRQQHQKGTKFHKKARNLLVHIVELSTAVVKVVIKVINVSLTQNQCLQRATLSLMHVEIPRPSDALNWTMTACIIKLSNVYYQTEPILSIFFERDLINDNSGFYSHHLSATDLQCHVFPFEKLLLNVRICL